MKKPRRIFVSTLFLVFFTSCSFLFPQKAEDVLNSKDMKVHQDWVGFYKKKNLSTDSHQLLSFENSKGELLRIFLFNDLSEQDAIKLAQERSFAIQSLFRDKNVPYVGKVTVQESCLSKNAVNSNISENEKGFFLEYSLLATQNFVYGRCSEEEDIFSSKYILQYCKKSRTLAEIKLFTKKERGFHAKTPFFICE